MVAFDIIVILCHIHVKQKKEKKNFLQGTKNLDFINICFVILLESFWNLANSLGTNFSFGQMLWHPLTVIDCFSSFFSTGLTSKVNPKKYGTKCAAHYVLDLAPGQEVVLKVRLYQSAETPRGKAFSADFEDIFEQRKLEADMFYDEVY